MAADEPSNLDEHINETICAITSAPEARYGQIQAVKSLVYHQKDTILVAATGYGKGAVLYAVGALTNKMDSAISAKKKVSDQFSKTRRSQQYQNRNFCCKIGGES